MAYSPGRWYVFVQRSDELPEETFGFGRNSEAAVRQHAERLREACPEWTITWGRRNHDGSKSCGA